MYLMIQARHELLLADDIAPKLLLSTIELIDLFGELLDLGGKVVGVDFGTCQRDRP
ncbi:hypothetical protein L0Y93_05000 [Burkholderia multivorans]|uniref:hypothetical protein n=1 Tax=Burkholderia multivorans TaxID=87883 RepID=UPI00207C30F7|nr:hypothetical protein [Burkholderia multivorans]MCO1460984.1 hypothetical protein [Burkholderia multivorans]